MMTFNKSQLPIPEADFRAAYDRYVQALKDHASTEGVPAPWPDYEIFRAFYKEGGFVVEDDTKYEVHEINAAATAARKAQFRRKTFTDREPT